MGMSVSVPVSNSVCMAERVRMCVTEALIRAETQRLKTQTWRESGARESAALDVGVVRSLCRRDDQFGLME